MEDDPWRRLCFLYPILRMKHNVISNMLECEEVFGELTIEVLIVMPLIEYDGHQILNATLVSQCKKPLTCLSPNFTLTLINQNDELKNSIYFLRNVKLQS